MPKIRKNQAPYLIPMLQLIPRETDKNYIVIMKDLNSILDTNENKEFIIFEKRFFYHYISKHKKYIVLKYYVIPNFDFDILSDFHYAKDFYHFENESIIYEIIENRYDKSGFIPNISPKCNEAYCTTCKMKPKNINELLNHLKSCRTFRYTLFHEKIPEDIRKEAKALVKSAANEENLKLKQLKEEEKLRAYYKTKYDIVLSYIMKKKSITSSEIKNFNSLPADKQFIYVARSEAWPNGSNFYKIGKTSSNLHLKSRLCQYNVGIDKYYFLCYFCCEGNACGMEKKILKHFKDQRVDNSEVLNVEYDTLLRYINTLLK
jgi:hypothetical protein